MVAPARRSQQWSSFMRKLATFATAAALAAGSLTFSNQAHAWDRGGAVAAGAIGGLAAGALIGAAVAGPGYWGGPAYAYAPAYNYEPAYAYDAAPVVRTRRVVRTTYAPRRIVRDRAVYAYAPRYAPRRVIRTYYADPYYAPVSYRYQWGAPALSVGFGYGPGYYGWR
jgi:hypothetical protein